MDLDVAAKRLEALGNPTRLGLYRLLVRAGPEGLAVGDLFDRTRIARSTLSHHLHRLIAVGLVTQERRGTTLVCRNEADVMTATLGFLLAECCADSDVPGVHQHLAGLDEAARAAPLDEEPVG